MKRTLMTLAAVLIAAGTAFAQVNIGAGYTGASHAFSEGSDRWYNGAYIQLGYNLPLGAGFEFNPSIQYNCAFRSEDVTIESGGATLATENKYNEHYLHVPLMFNYGYEISKNARIFVYAGPTASFGLYAGGKGKAGAEFGGVSIATDDKSVSLYDKDSDYRRWDVKVGGGIGIDICRHYRINVGYDYGLLDRWKGDGTLHTHVIQAGFAYLFR